MTAPDLHALAAEAIWATGGLDWAVSNDATGQRSVEGDPGEMAAAALAAVLPAHRAQVLDEAIGALDRRAAALPHGPTRQGVALAMAVLRRLALDSDRDTPATPPSAPLPAQDGPPAVQEAPEAQRGAQGAAPDDELRALADLTADEYGPLPHAIGDAARRELTARAERAEAERDEYVAEAEWHRLAAERHRLAAERAEATIARMRELAGSHPDCDGCCAHALTSILAALDGTEEPAGGGQAR